MPRDRRLVKLCRLVTEDLAANHSRVHYAARVGISCRSLTRLFQLQTGMGFLQWRQKARLLAALQRLGCLLGRPRGGVVGAVQRLGAGRSVTEVALALGYRSPSAFSAMFRRVLGISPSELMRD
jgi:AraC-like DNA-binding protein